MTDAAFARAFEHGEVTPADFDHAAHMRVAWVYLHEAASPVDALDRMRGAIQRFAAAAGKSQKYHETITVAWMILLEDARARHRGAREFSEVLRADPALADKDLPLRYYSRDHLFSDRARLEWVEPDVAPLPTEASCVFES